MMQRNMIKIFTGVNKIIRESTNVIKDSGSDYIEQNILKGKYVTREEYEQLKNLVLELKEEITKLKP